MVVAKGGRRASRACPTPSRQGWATRRATPVLPTRSLLPAAPPSATVSATLGTREPTAELARSVQRGHSKRQSAQQGVQAVPPTPTPPREAHLPPTASATRGTATATSRASLPAPRAKKTRTRAHGQTKPAPCALRTAPPSWAATNRRIASATRASPVLTGGSAARATVGATNPALGLPGVIFHPPTAEL